MTSEINQESSENIEVRTHEKLTLLEKYKISPVLFSVLSLIFIFFAYQGIGGILTYFLVGLDIDESKVDTIRILTAGGEIFLLLIPTLILARVISNRLVEFLKINSTKITLIILSLIGIFSLQQVLQVYIYFQDMIPIPKSLEPIIKTLKETIERSYKLIITARDFKELVCVTFVAAIIPALAEETVFRGFFQSALEKKYSPIKSVLISGIVFSLFHLNPINFIPLAILGIYLSFIFYQSNSLVIPVAAHFFNNFLAVVALYLGLGEETLINVNSDNVSISMLLLNLFFFGIVFLFSLYLFIRVSNIKFINENN